MKYYGWSRIAILSLVLGANLAAALFAAFFSMAFSMVANADILLPSLPWTPSLHQRLGGLLHILFVATVVLVVVAGPMCFCNRSIYRALKMSERATRKWMFWLGLIIAGGVLSGAGFVALQVMQAKAE